MCIRNMKSEFSDPDPDIRVLEYPNPNLALDAELKRRILMKLYIALLLK